MADREFLDYEPLVNEDLWWVFGLLGDFMLTLAVRAVSAVGDFLFAVTCQKFD